MDPDHVEYSPFPCLRDRVMGKDYGGFNSRNAISSYKKSVLEELGYLLNSARRPKFDNYLYRRSEDFHTYGEDIYRYPEVARSVLNYGIRDLTGLTVSSLDPYVLQEEIKAAIILYEPRIVPSSLEVEFVETTMIDTGVISFRLAGLLWTPNQPIEFAFQTKVDVESGNFMVTDTQ